MALKLAIIGTDGLITESLLAVIDDHPTLCGEVVLLGDETHAGECVEFGQQTLLVTDLALGDFNEFDIVVSTGELPQSGFLPVLGCSARPMADNLPQCCGCIAALHTGI